MQGRSLEQALAGLPIGPIRYFKSISSTNDEAARWAQAGAIDLALVVADEQTAGRGRAGRKWFTPPGAALAFSLVLNPPFQGGYPQDAQSITARLTGLGALAVSQALNRDYNLPAQIKWPNDVLLESRKVAGVLVEAHWLGEELVSAILGIGVNVRGEAIPALDELIFPATCIQAHLENPISRPLLLRSILAHLLEWRGRLDNNRDFLSAWEKSLAYLGEWVQISIPDQGADRIMKGQVIGLDSSGELKLRDEEDHITKVHSGEIRLRPVSPPTHNRGE